jgi:hypothetical protein
VVDGTPGTGDMPGSIEFHTTTVGGETLAERMRVTSGGEVAINFASAGNNVTKGLLISMGTEDDNILEFQEEGIAQTITAENDATTWGAFRKFDLNYGGMRIQGHTQSNQAIAMYAMVDSAITAKAANQHAAWNVYAYQRNTTTAPYTGATVLGPNANIGAFHTAGGTVWIVDEDGDVHYSGTTNAEDWDDYDDVALLDTFRAVTTNNYGKTFSSWTEENKKVLHDTGVITLNDDGHHFVSTKGLNGLLVDSIRQLYQSTTRHMDELNSRNEKLEARLMALEGAS